MIEKPLEFEEQVTTECPFCSGKISADNGDNSGTPAVMHTQPTCAKFDALDPLEFLVVVNTEVRTRNGIGYA